MKKVYKIVILFFLLIVAVFGLPLIAGQPISLSEVIKADTLDFSIYWKLRFPRMVLGLICGGGLALVGLIFQSIFRNSLASPYTLGVASGASLFVVLTISFLGSVSVVAQGGMIFMAFMGANLSILLIYLLAQSSGQLQTGKMILAGVALSYIFSAIIAITYFYSNTTETYQMLRWMMGGLEVKGYQFLWMLGPLAIISIVLLFLMIKPINIISTSGEFAAGKGVDVHKIQKYSFLTASLLTAGIVSYAGPIAFVGLMIPHIVRQIFGVNLKHNFLPVLLTGGLFLISVDSVARYLFYPVDFPVGILTGILGGPFFLLLLYKERKNR
ncbi:MAG: iron ABC transporter permease [Calditrichia bacterium]